MADEAGSANGGDAPGWPGIAARWTSAGKSGVGTALEGSPLWFTLSHGILNEVYAPRIDEAMTRDLGFLVTGPDGYFSEPKRDAIHRTTQALAGVPCYQVRSACRSGRYLLESEVWSDPARLVVLVRIKLNVLKGAAADYRLHALVAPHLANHGADNTAWVGDYKGEPGLYAARDGHALCLMSSAGFGARSAGFVGVSDGWQQLQEGGRLRECYQRAGHGNVALVGELPAQQEIVLALGFGRNGDEAAIAARASLAEGAATIRERYVRPWQAWHARLRSFPGFPLAATSAMVIKAHESRQIPGALLASLAVPWGFSKGDGDLGGYHLIWPRDMVESAGALAAVGATTEARDALVFLAATQEADGHWPQNMWLDGQAYWQGLQLDETALPILLFDLLAREGALWREDIASARFWPMVRKAAAYVVRNGPVTQQDRWEENGGYTPYTLGAAIAALLAAADWAERCGEPALAPTLRETADSWHAQLDDWLYVRDTALARRLGLEGYYVRIRPPGRERCVMIRNRSDAAAMAGVDEVISTDALALVRFGLRAADDPRILATIGAIDATLRQDTQRGPCWHRYTGDGYGEHADGSPFDGTGEGRLWPLLTGERAHHALALGRRAEALALCRALEQFASDEGLLPEQCWDADDLPALELLRARPSGSAMPLVWAHAEYLKLARSIQDGRVYDLPPQAAARYLAPPAPGLPGADVPGQGLPSLLRCWSFAQPREVLRAGEVLRIGLLAPARVHWSGDGWRTTQDAATRDTGLGWHVLDLPTTGIAPGTSIRFTFYWPESRRWEGNDFELALLEPNA
jgi:glucoamylase